MTYGYMRNYEDRVRRAVNTPDATAASPCGRAAWSPTSPSARSAASQAGMKRAVAGAEREQREGASGKWVAHWKMVHIVRPVWEKAGQDNQLGRPVPRAHLHGGRCRRPGPARAGAAHRPRRARPAQRRPAVRQRVRPGVPGGGAEAGRLLRQRRRPLPDGGHGDRRDPPQHPLGVAAQGGARSPRPTKPPASRRGDAFSAELFERLLAEEYAKLLAGEQPRRPRRLQDDDAADRARDRRDLRRRPVQGALVHRPAQHQPRQSRPGGGEAADRPVHGCVRPGRHPHHPEPGFRGREIAAV